MAIALSVINRNIPYSVTEAILHQVRVIFGIPRLDVEFIQAFQNVGDNEAYMSPGRRKTMETSNRRHEIKRLEEQLMTLLRPNVAQWDLILSLIESVEAHELYKELGHRTLFSWLRKIMVFSRLTGHEFRYDPKTSHSKIRIN